MYEDTKSELVERGLPCTMCSSSDAMSVYRVTDKKGRTYHNASCFSCKGFEPDPPGYTSLKDLLGLSPDRPTGGETHGQSVSPASESTPSFPRESLESILDDFKSYPIRALTHRGISKEACEKYGVRVSLSPQDGETILTHKYPYFKKNKLTGYKERIVENKIIYSKGDCRDVSLFGIHCTNPNGKTLYITEGELDCLALYQVLKGLSNIPGWEPSVVSLSHGAASAARDISIDLDFVNSFEKIVLVFDNDDAGESAVEEACRLLAGKVFIAKLSEKDPNDMLRRGKGEEMKWEVMKYALPYMPDDIVDYADCWERYKNSRNTISYPWPKEWRELNRQTYGVRLGELITITSGTGMGKTQFMREIRYHYHFATDFTFADIALEEDVGDTQKGMVALHLNKRIQLPDVNVPEEVEQQAFNELFGGSRWAGIDFFGGLDDSTLFSKIRFFAGQGRKIVYLDHLSIIVSEFAIEGNERERIDTMMTKLKKLAKELNIIIFLVVHLKKSDGGLSFEEGAVPDLDDLRGSSCIKQLSDGVIALSRNQQHDDPFCANTSLITNLKCRFTGRTGKADYLYFNDVTGRMTPVPCPTGYHPVKTKAGNLGRAQF